MVSTTLTLSLTLLRPAIRLTLTPHCSPTVRLLPMFPSLGARSVSSQPFTVPTFKLSSGKEMPTIAWGNYSREWFEPGLGLPV